jgi:hypothetical protein
MKVFLTRAEQLAHLNIARNLTRSKDFKSDAEAIAGYSINNPDDPSEIPRLRSIAVIENRSIHDAWMHFCGVTDDWFHPELARIFFTFVFHKDAMGIKRLRSPIPEWHIQAQVVALRTGFRFEAKLSAGAADGSDAILMMLTPERCRWMQDAAPVPA